MSDVMESPGADLPVPTNLLQQQLMEVVQMDQDLPTSMLYRYLVQQSIVGIRVSEQQREKRGWVETCMKLIREELRSRRSDRPDNTSRHRQIMAKIIQAAQAEIALEEGRDLEEVEDVD